MKLKLQLKECELDIKKKKGGVQTENKEKAKNFQVAGTASTGIDCLETLRNRLDKPLSGLPWNRAWAT